MKHARPDYDRIQDPANLIPDDEPVFLIRGQDVAAGDAVRDYAERARAAGCGQDLIDACLAHAERMDAWPKKKTADL